MPDLEKIVTAFEEEKKIHKEFRLFLTTMAVIYFPVPILQMGVKMTIEPPKGIKSNIIRSLNAISDEMLTDCAKPRQWKKLLISLCFFHSIV
jgi:dynein heavy chain